MIHYFSLQFIFLKRKIKDFGLNPSLGLFLIFGLFAFISVLLFRSVDYAEYIYFAIASSTLVNLTEKTRNDFLKLQFGKNKRLKIRLIENSLIFVPYLIFLVIYKHYLIILLLLLMSLFLAFKSYKNGYNITLPTPFGKQPFEFTIGFRKTFLAHIFSFALAVISVLNSNFNLGLVTLFAVFLTSMSYYTKPENEYFVWIFKLKPRQFLKQKIILGILQATLLALPISLILLLNFSQNWAIILFTILFGFIYLAVIILAKYSAFPKEMSVPQAIIISISIFFPPLLLVIIPYLYKRAKQNLIPMLK